MEKFRGEGPRDMRFLHKDEFESEFDQRFNYPVVLEHEEGQDGTGQLSVLLSRRELDRMNDVDELIDRLRDE